MLGTSVSRVLSDRSFDVVCTTRRLDRVAGSDYEYRAFDVLADELSSVLEQLPWAPDYVVNCIGLIKHHIRDNDPELRRAAIRINADFPYELDSLAEQAGFTVIQIATDCVFSGTVGSYGESALHDATDVYGQTKSLGEVPTSRFLNLRCSIIGREQSGMQSLLEWVLGHAPGESFNGYLDHHWNGVTTDTFANVVAGIMENGTTWSGVQHLVPADAVNKAELSAMILDAFDRTDVEVHPLVTGAPIDRTLRTERPAVNATLWQQGGYASPLTIHEMVTALARSRE